MADMKKVGKIAKQRGYRAEKFVLETLKKMGFNVYRTPASGGGKYLKKDIILENDDSKHPIEVKSRQDKKLNALVEFIHKNHLDIIFTYKEYYIFNISVFQQIYGFYLNVKEFVKIDITDIYNSALLDNFLKKIDKRDILAIKNNDNKKNKVIFIIKEVK